MNGIFEAKDKWMKIYYEWVTKLMKRFQRRDIQAIKRELNVRVDGLAKGAAYGEYEKKKVMTTPGDDLKDVNMIDAKEEEEGEILKDNWMDPIIDYLQDSKFPKDKNKVRKLRLKAARYTLLEVFNEGRIQNSPKNNPFRSMWKSFQRTKLGS